MQFNLMVEYYSLKLSLLHDSKMIFYLFIQLLVIFATKSILFFKRTLELILHDQSQYTVVLGKNGRHSFGRTRDRIPPPTRAILSERIGNGKTGTPVNDHRRASALETRLDLKLVRCEKETRFEGCELKKEREK